MTTPQEPEQSDGDAVEPSPAPGAPAQPDALAAAAGLQSALTTMAKRLGEAVKASEDRDEKLKRYGRHNRWFIYADIALTVAFTCLAFWVNSTSRDASAANTRSEAASTKAASASAAASAQQAASVASCQQGNQIRAQQRELNQQGLALWESLRSTPKTAAQAKAILRFQANIKAADVQRNCAAAYAAPKAVPTNGAG